jgi:uncharacterized protein YkwD
MKKLMVIIVVLLMGATASFAQSRLEKGIIEEMNLARTKPRLYAEYVKEFRTLYKGNRIYLPGSTVRIPTVEGVSAVDEAVRFLLKQKPLAPFEFSRGLSEAAADLVADQSSSGDTGHNGRLSGSMSQRIERHGQWRGSIGENIGYGYDNPRWVVIQLIVDDGVRNRGHRKNIFKPDFRRAGVACGSHPEYTAMCVTDFAEGFSR